MIDQPSDDDRIRDVTRQVLADRLGRPVAVGGVTTFRRMKAYRVGHR